MMNNGGAQISQANHLQLIGGKGKFNGKQGLLAMLAKSLFPAVPGSGKVPLQFGGLLNQLKGLTPGLGIQTTHDPALAGQSQFPGRGKVPLTGLILVQQQPGKAKAPALGLNEVDLLPHSAEGPGSLFPVPIPVGTLSPATVLAKSGSPAGSSEEASTQPGSETALALKGQVSGQIQVAQLATVIQGPAVLLPDGVPVVNSQAVHVPTVSLTGQPDVQPALGGKGQAGTPLREPRAQPQPGVTQNVVTLKGKALEGVLADGDSPKAQVPHAQPVESNIPAKSIPEGKLTDEVLLDARKPQAPKVTSKLIDASAKASLTGTKENVSGQHRPQPVAPRVTSPALPVNPGGIPVVAPAGIPNGIPIGIQPARLASDGRSMVVPVRNMLSDDQTRQPVQQSQTILNNLPRTRRVRVVAQHGPPAKMASSINHAVTQSVQIAQRPGVQQVTTASLMQPATADGVEVDVATLTAERLLNQGKPEPNVSLTTHRPETPVVAIRPSGQGSRIRQAKRSLTSLRKSGVQSVSRSLTSVADTVQVKGNGSIPANSLTNEGKLLDLFQSKVGTSDMLKPVTVGASTEGERSGGQPPALLTPLLHTPAPAFIPTPASLTSLGRLVVLQYERYASSRQDGKVFSFDSGLLGNVRMTFTEEAAGTTLQIMVESSEMQKLLQRTLPTLELQWTQQGLNFGNVNVEVGNSGSKNGSLERETAQKSSTLSSEMDDEVLSEYVESGYKDYGYNTLDFVA